MKFGSVPIKKAKGSILAHSTRLPNRVLKKGHVLSEDDVILFIQQGIKDVIVAQLEPNDVAENDAATLITSKLYADNIIASDAFTGRCNLVADARGLLLVDQERLNKINLIDESVTVATSEAYGITSVGQLVATIKIIPFSVKKSVLTSVNKAIGNKPLISISRFNKKAIGLIMTRLPGMKENILDKTLKVAEGRITEFNSQITKEIRCEHRQSDVANAIEVMKKNDCDIILIFGASAVVDRADILPSAVTEVGGKVEHFGMPVDPGNLLFIGNVEEIAIIGMPGCARSPKLNGFDWVLWRLLANVPVTGRDIMLMGNGGLLKEINERGQLRQFDNPKVTEAKEPKIGGLLLAAGSSRRMGKENKLLQEINGTKMVVHVAEQIRNSKISEVLIVTGYEAEKVEASLKNLGYKFVYNSKHVEGLSSSLKLGLDSISKDIDGVIICLGDMPLIKSQHIDSIIRAFDPTEGRSICVPIHGRKRGNPVLWGKEYFEEILAIKGDAGAKHLLEKYSDQIIEVQIDTKGILIDVDTPERLDELKMLIKS